MWQVETNKRIIVLTAIDSETRIAFCRDDILIIKDVLTVDRTEIVNGIPHVHYKGTEVKIVLRSGDVIHVKESFDRVMELAYGPEKSEEEEGKS